MTVWVVIESHYVPAEAPCPLETVLSVHATSVTALREVRLRAKQNKCDATSFHAQDFELIGGKNETKDIPR